MKTIWFIEIQCLENNQVVAYYFKTSCSKYNTSLQRSRKWGDNNKKYVIDIISTRISEFELDKYKQLTAF